VKPKPRSHIFVGRRPNRGRPPEAKLEPSLSAAPVTITDAAGNPVASYDPWTRRRYPAAEFAALCRRAGRRRAQYARTLGGLA